MTPVLPTGEGWSAVQEWIEQTEQRLATLETPASPTPLFAMPTSLLSVANAARYTNCQVFATDLKCPAVSDGIHWYRADTGAKIA